MQSELFEEPPEFLFLEVVEPCVDAFLLDVFCVDAFLLEVFCVDAFLLDVFCEEPLCALLLVELLFFAILSPPNQICYEVIMSMAL